MFKIIKQQSQNQLSGFKVSAWLVMILLLLIYASPAAAWADISDWSDGFGQAFDQAAASQSQVINNVSASASTGGNTAQGGEVVQGQSQSSLKIETIINGQTVEAIDINETSDSGQAEVKAESKTEVNDDTATVETTTEINGQRRQETKTVDLDADNSQQSASGGTIINTEAAADNDLEIAENNATASAGGLEEAKADQSGQTAADNNETTEGNDITTVKISLAKFFTVIFNNFRAGLNRLWSWFS